MLQPTEELGEMLNTKFTFAVLKATRGIGYSVGSSEHMRVALEEMCDNHEGCENAIQRADIAISEAYQFLASYSRVTSVAASVINAGTPPSSPRSRSSKIEASPVPLKSLDGSVQALHPLGALATSEASSALSKWPGYDVSVASAPSAAALPKSTQQPTPHADQHIVQITKQDAPPPLPEHDQSVQTLEHVENFNLMVAGESGLGKSTLLRCLFAHLEPTKTLEMKKAIAEKQTEVDRLKYWITRNTQAQFECSGDNDERSLELLEEKRKLRTDCDAAEQELKHLKEEKSKHDEEVARLAKEVDEIDRDLTELRRQRDQSEDVELAKQIVDRSKQYLETRNKYSAQLHRQNLDPDESKASQTLKIEECTIESMPLYEGAKDGLEVTKIDMPGYGDLTSHRSAENMVNEVDRRITAHLQKHLPTRRSAYTSADPDRYMPLDDEKKYWNDLVHMCLFFIPPHRMKRADVDLMKRLHALVPLVVVIAKSDTMKKAETKKFKETVRAQLAEEGIKPFYFGMDKIREVEARHKEEVRVISPAEGDAQLAQEFEPLYGGANGELPWAVMGADDSFCREYPWGTARIDDPRHSELPALRDLLLRAGGWQELKEAASRKADEEAARRSAKSMAQRAVSQVVAIVNAKVPRRLLIRVGLLLFFVITLWLGMWLGPHLASSQTTAGKVTGCEDAHNVLLSELSVTSSKLNETDNRLIKCTNARRTLDAGVSECGNARRALERDLSAANAKLEVKERDSLLRNRDYGYLVQKISKCWC